MSDNIKLSIEDMNLFYGNFHALHDINMHIPEKEITAFIGPSGCGKSTLGKTLMRLHTPTSGEVLYNGVDIASMPMKEFKKNYRTNIQMIFQDPYASLDPRMNVLQLIEEPIKVNHKDM